MSTDGTLPLHEMPGHLIRRVHQQSLALYATRAGGFGLTPVQYAALHAIGGCPDSDQVGIARAVACDKATIGAVIDRLQSKGLVSRAADAADRRVRRLRLTDAGRALLERIEPAVAQVQRDLLAPLDEHQAQRLMELLAILAWPVRHPEHPEQLERAERHP
jgi:DNA-binding MarR family transcriptional regulator